VRSFTLLLAALVIACLLGAILWFLAVRQETTGYAHSSLAPATPTTMPAAMAQHGLRELTSSASELGASIRGLVVDTEGVGVSDARVFIVNRTDDVESILIETIGSRSPAKPDAITDSAGQFALPVEVAGSPLIALGNSGGYCFTSAWSPAEKLIISKGGELQLHITNEGNAFSPIIGAQVRLWRLSLRSLPPNRFLPETDVDLRALAGVEERVATTNASGDAVFQNIRGGVFAVQVEVSNLRRAFFAPMSLRESEPLHIVLGRAARVDLRVHSKDTGSAIPDARARLFSIDGGGESYSEWFPANSDGLIRLEGPFLGLDRTHALVSADGYGTESVLLQELVKEPLVDRVVRLESATSVSGRVLDSAGNPIAGAFVSAIVDQERLTARTTSSRDGSFAISAISKSAALTLVIGKDGYVQAQFGVTTRGELPEPVRLARAGTLTLEIENLPTETAGAKRRVLVWTRLESATTGYGAFRSLDASTYGEKPISIPLEGSGRYRVRIQCTSRAVSESLVEVEDEENATLRVSLARGTRVRGLVVRGEDHQPISGAGIVVLLPSPPGALPTDPSGIGTTTGPDGRFVLDDQAPGPISLFVHDSMRAGRFVSTRVSSAPEHDLGTLELRAYPSVRGRVLSDSALPSDAFMKLLDSNADEVGSAPIASDGAYEFPSLPQGRYGVGVGTQGDTTLQTALSSFYLRSGEQKILDVQYGPAQLEGRISPAPSSPRESFQAVLKSPKTGAGLASRLVRRDGSFNICGLPVGPVELSIRSWGGNTAGLQISSITLVAGKNEVVIPQLSSSLLIRIKDMAGTPVAGAKTFLYANTILGVPAPVSSDGQGTLRLSNLLSGDYRVAFRAPGFEFVPRESIHISAEKQSELDVMLHRESPLLVRLLDRANKPLTSLSVRVPRVDGYGGTPPIIESDGLGEASFHSLGAGLHRVEVLEDPAFFHTEREISLSAERPHEAIITLRRTGALRIRVMNKEGAPVAGVSPTIAVVDVPLESTQWLSRGWCTTSREGGNTGPDGTIEFRGLPEGEATVSCPGSVPTLIKIEPGRTSDVMLLCP